MTDSEYKNCPYCDEEIKALAIKCKHCQSFLDEKNENMVAKNEQSKNDNLADNQEFEAGKTKGFNFNRAESSIVINNDIISIFSPFSEPFNGDYKIALIEKRDFESPIKHSLLDKYFKARGKFVGIKYEIQNNTDDQITPSMHFNDFIVATDGIRKWHPHSDATHIISSKMEGLSFADYLGAGFDDFTWVVFDIPVDAEIVGLACVDFNSTQKPILIKLP